MKKSKHILSVAAVMALGATSLVGCVSAGDGKAGVSLGNDGAVVSAPGATVSGGADGAKVEASDASVGASSDGATAGAGAGGSASSTRASGSSEPAGSREGSSDAVGDLPLRPGWDTLIKDTVACSGGVAEVQTTGAVVRLDEACDTVVVEATGATVVLTEPVGSLRISGSGNTVAGAALTAVEISGTGNTVAYAGSKPTVDDRGTGSVVSDATIALPGSAG